MYRNERFITMKPSFLITGSDLLFNKLDEIEIPIIGFHYLRNSIISDSDFKRYPVLSLKWLLYCFKELSPDIDVLVYQGVDEWNAVVLGLYSQATKRIRWMPWQSEAMKDVEACDKVRGAGKRAVIRTSLNGETHRLSGRYLALNP